MKAYPRRSETDLVKIWEGGIDCALSLRHLVSRGMCKNYRRRKNNPSRIVNGMTKMKGRERLRRRRPGRRKVSCWLKMRKARRRRLASVRGREAGAREDASSVNKERKKKLKSDDN